MPRPKIPEEVLEMLREFGPLEERIESSEDGALFEAATPRERRSEDKETRSRGDKEKRGETPGKARRKNGRRAKRNMARQRTSNGDSRADGSSSASSRSGTEVRRKVDRSLPAGERGPLKSLILWEEMKQAALAKAAEAERASGGGSRMRENSDVGAGGDRTLTSSATNEEASRPLRAGRAAKWEPLPPHAMIPSPAQPVLGQFMHRSLQRRVDWLWEGRIPEARLSLLAGDPGVGKSMVALDIAARVSSGAPWPDSPGVARQPGNVIIFSLEDNVDDTIAPRLSRAGAAMNRICVIDGVCRPPPIVGFNFRRRFCVPEDLPSLIPLIADLAPVSLIIFDPIMAYCGKGDGHRAASVHAMLAPLAEMAQDAGISMLCTIHLRHAASRKAIYRMAGDPAFTTASRAVWGLMRDEDSQQKGRRLMLPVKSNLGGTDYGLAFQIDHEGKLVWEEGLVEADANVKFAEKPEKEDVGKLIEAVDWLRAALAAGPQPTTDIEERARKSGVADRTLRRARELLGIQRRRKGFGPQGRQFLCLPGDSRPCPFPEGPAAEEAEPQKSCGFQPEAEASEPAWKPEA